MINPDGICYLQSAATLDAGLSVARHLCDQGGWPFYPMLIYGFVKVSGLSYLAAAFTLNGLFTLISVLMFVRITALLTNSSRVVWLSAWVILLAHQFNAMRPDVIRDHGFWATYLISLFFLLHFFREKRWIFVLCWGLALNVAVLFRVEGAIFLFTLPWVAWLDVRENWLKRLTLFLKLGSIAFFWVAVLAAWLILHPEQHLGRLSEVQFQLLHGVQNMLHHFNATAKTLAEHILNSYSKHDASLVLFVMLAGWYVVSVATNVSLIYAVLIIYAWCKKLSRFDVPAKLVLWGYVATNILITGLFLSNELFLSKRYLIGLSLTLMFWVPFALDYLIQQWRVRKWPLIFVIIFIIYYALGGIFEFGPSKKYIRDAGDWIAMNTSPEARIYSNDYQLMYYSKHFGNELFTFTKSREFKEFNQVQWQEYDYLVLRINKNRSELTKDQLKRLSGTPVKIFKNKRGDEVVIYQVLH